MQASSKYVRHLLLAYPGMVLQGNLLGLGGSRGDRRQTDGRLENNGPPPPPPSLAPLDRRIKGQLFRPILPMRVLGTFVDTTCGMERRRLGLPEF